MTKKKSEGKTLKIRQKASPIGTTRAMRETLKGLGLRKIGQESERPDTPATRGMVAKIHHLVEIVDDNR